MKTVYLGLGTNMGNREEYLAQGLKALTDHPSIDLSLKSSIYETAPIGYIDQDFFLNRVIVIKTTLEPLALLKFCQQVEHSLDRKRTLRWGPRTLDIDILLYEDLVIETEELTLPHPRMIDRAFVLIPLQEIAPDIVIKDQQITTLIATIGNQGVLKFQSLHPS